MSDPIGYDGGQGGGFSEPDHYSAPAAWAEVRRARAASDADERLSAPPPCPSRPRIAVIYIAGPYTAIDALAVEQNVRRAEDAAYAVARLGAMPCCPHTNLRYMAADLAAFLYPATLELMRRCDAVFFLPDWMTSSGARGEREEAKRVGLPCFDLWVDLKAWLAGRK